MSIIRRRPLEVKPKMESGKNHRFAYSVGRTTSIIIAAHEAGAIMLLQAEFPPSYYRGTLLAQRIQRPSEGSVKLKSASQDHDAPFLGGNASSSWYSSFQPASRVVDGKMEQACVLIFRPEKFRASMFHGIS